MIIPNLPFDIPKLPSPPTFEISPVPEQIFLRTVKGLLSFAINLSLLDSSLVLIIILLVNANPSIRGKAAVVLSILLLVFGLEISFVNVYVLVRRFCFLSGTLLTRFSIRYALDFPLRLLSSLLRSSSWESSIALCPL